MFFYEVLPSSGQFHGKAPLTYSYDSALAVGSVVVVPLRNRDVVGIVVSKVAAPTFKTKPIVKTVLKDVIPEASLVTLEWLRQYYPAPLGTLAQLILPSSLLRKRDLAAVEAPAGNPSPTAMPKLTKQQAVALNEMKRSSSRSFLLHGDTGSGKTRLYLELAQQTLSAGKSVLLLTPEIGLTPQLEQRVRRSLAAPVVVMHSNLTPAQRRQVWLQIITSQQPMVVIGPRSALFTPLRQIGLIVMDEAHDAAYKQDQAPHYLAARVAAKLAAAHGAQLVLGTATPLISEYALMQAKQVPIIRLTGHPAGQATDKQVTVVNLRDRQQFPAQPHLSLPLIQQIKLALGQHQQSLVFLNRRGTARLVMCQSCGWQALCPNCDLPLTYHGDNHQLRCHTCGLTQVVPSSCPVCNSTDILFKSIGTKSLASELQATFPEARIKRFDADNHKADRLEQQFKDIDDGQTDILVGTQILAKGLDLPNLTVVGVVVADTSLYFPDYTADEQTFQLLTQVMGRVGRGHKSGQIIIQSYSPDSPAIKAAAEQDWQSFYQNQLAERQRYDFPPFYHLLKLTASRASSKAAAAAAERLHRSLSEARLKIKVSQPAPSFYERVGGKHHWQLVVRAKDRSQLLRVVEQLPAGWSFDIDPLNLL